MAWQLLNLPRKSNVVKTSSSCPPRRLSSRDPEVDMADEQTNDEGTAPKKDGFANGEVISIEGEEHVVVREDEITGVIER
ncbi:hypothetical protein ACI1MP_35820 [Kitasatospora griseola]|uniref:hypothetical protein n=1 Tax=Kitasatospora griseola TaxID=2064 RepID=UPI003855C684